MFFYGLQSDGKTNIADINLETPYACFTHFNPETSVVITKELTFDALKNKIDSLFLSKNLIYPIQVTGHFKSIKAKSVGNNRHIGS